jgi:hypothetical protein
MWRVERLECDYHCMAELTDSGPGGPKRVADTIKWLWYPSPSAHIWLL